MVDPRKEPLLRQVAAESFGQMMSERRTTDLLMMSQSLVVSLEGFCRFAMLCTGRNRIGGVGSPSHHHG